MVAKQAEITFKTILQNKQFVRLTLAQLISAFGDWMAIVAMFSLVAFRMGAAPYQVSWIMISFLFPIVVLGPLAGVYADRWPVKRTMIASDLLRAIIVVSLSIPTNLIFLCILVMLLSAVSCFFQPSQTIAVRLMFRKEELLIANSISTQVQQLNRIISPLIAGVFVGWLGERNCFYIDGLTFVISAVLLATLTVRRERDEGEGAEKSTRREIAEGLRFIYGNKAILFLTVAMASAIFAFGAYDSLIVVYIRDILSASSQLYGLMISLTATGTIAGALLVGSLGRKQAKLHLITFGILGVGVSIFVLASFNTVYLILPPCFFLGVALAYAMVPAQTLLQEETPQGMLGRVSSAAAALITTTQIISFLLAGIIASWIGIRPLYWLVALALVAIGVTGYAYARVNKLAEASASNASQAASQAGGNT
jgi:MFS transporter, DHA3 family, macrolide efflux protein